MNHRMLLLLTVLLSNCSLVLDFEDCEKNSDCPDKLTCSDGICQADSEKPALEDLLTAPCQKIYGVSPADALDDDVFLLGSLLPYTGGLATYGPPMDQAVELAVGEINQIGGIFGKKIAVLSCDTGTDSATAQKAADILVNTAKVPAIVGAASSTNTIDVFTEVAKDAGVLMISPASSSTALTDLFDNGLVWRTVPSDAAQGAAIAQHLLQQKFKKVAVVNRDDTYGNALQKSIQEPWCAENECPGSYQSYSYGGDAPFSGQSEALVSLVDFEPEVIVLVGYVEDGIQFLNSAATKGFKNFVLTDGMKNEELMEKVTDKEVLCRAIGTNPADPSGTTYKAFEINYQSKWKTPPSVYNAHSYDALYLLAYSIAGSDMTPAELNGAILAENLKRLSSGPRIEVGTQAFNGAIQTLKSSTESTIDFVGASGALDFNNDKGEAQSSVEAWYFDLAEKNTIGSLKIIFTESGEYTPPAFPTTTGPCSKYRSAQSQ